MKEYEKSIEINRMATLKMPGVVNPYLNIGKTFLAIGEADSALYYLKIADQILPNNPEIV